MQEHPEGWQEPAPAKTPVETKVKAASLAALVSGFLVSIISHTLLKDSPVPDVIVSAIDAIVVSAGTFLSAWLAKHTPRW